MADRRALLLGVGATSRPGDAGEDPGIRIRQYFGPHARVRLRGHLPSDRTSCDRRISANGELIRKQSIGTAWF
jgi:hypothetical protein